MIGLCVVSMSVSCIYGWYDARGEFKGAWEIAGTAACKCKW